MGVRWQIHESYGGGCFYGCRNCNFYYLVTLMLLGFYAPNSFEFFYTQATVGLIAVFSVQKLSKRSDLFRATLMVFITYFIVYMSMMLIQEGSVESFSWRSLGYFTGSSILILLAFPMYFSI